MSRLRMTLAPAEVTNEAAVDHLPKRHNEILLSQPACLAEYAAVRITAIDAGKGTLDHEQFLTCISVDEVEKHFGRTVLALAFPALKHHPGLIRGQTGSVTGGLGPDIACPVELESMKLKALFVRDA